MTHATEGGGRGDPGVLLIQGDPAVLDAFAHDVTAAGEVAGQVLGDYNAAMMTLADQPIDPTFTLPPNRLFEVGARYQGVETACVTATVFAQALRELDASGDGALDAIDGLDPNLFELYVNLKAGNPDFPAEDADLPGLLTELYRQNGGSASDETVRSDLQELVDAGLITADEAENPALVTYFINRGSSPLGAREEWELNDLSIGEDGTISALGMDHWDPAVLAEVQKALDEHAAADVNEHIANGTEMGHISQPPPGQTGYYSAEWAEAYRELQEQYRRYAGEKLVEDLASKGDRGFYSADEYDDLIDGFNDGSNSRYEDALVHSMTHSATSGGIPVYQMSGWEKFRDGISKVAVPIGWIGVAAAFVPGGQIPGAIVKGSAFVVGTATAVTITDQCVVNPDGDQCATTVVIAGIGRGLPLKSKAIRRHFAQNGPLSEADERLLHGLEAFESFTDQSLTVITAPTADYDLDE